MDESATHQGWPVSWRSAVVLARANGQHPDVFLRDQGLAAHRILDRLAAAAVDVHSQLPGARQAMRGLLADTIRAVPWLTPAHDEIHPHGQSDCGSCGSEDRITGENGFSSGGGTTWVNDDGISTLASLAGALAGDAASTAIRRLGAAARAAETYIPGLQPRSQGELASDLALLATSPSDSTGSHEIRTAPTPTMSDGLDDGFWDHISRTAALDTASPCQAWLARLSIDDLDQYPQPTGTATNTTGIERVDVPDPCGPAPRLTIHGHGFGAHRPPNVNVVVATWDSGSSELIYRNAQDISWTDDTIVVQLPSNVVPGYAAFSDVEFVTEYNAWVDGRNSRINVAMHAHGCPGHWTVEQHLPLIPDPNPAAGYRAGAPVLMGQLFPSIGATQLWDSTTVHLHTGDAFQIGWRVYGADTLSLKPSFDDDKASEILSAAGYPASGASLTPQDGFLTLASPAQPARATFILQADNGCGTIEAPLTVMITHPPLAEATTTVFQSLTAGGDVTVTNAAGTESLNPPTGDTIPLVAGKRTVVRIDWWLATEQLPAYYFLSAQASVQVTGFFLPPGGVTVMPSFSTADLSPPATPFSQASGPGFTSVSEYQQWVSGGGRTNPFYVVLPPELCQGGNILGTPTPAVTAIVATITLTAPDGGPTWTLTAGTTVTFHPRRKVTLRYLPFAFTDPTLIPTDAQCEAALKVAGSMLPVPDPDIFRLPGQPVLSDGHLVEDLEAQRTAQQGAFSDAWRDEIWLLMGTWGIGGVNLGEYVVAANIDPVVCAHEIGHSYGQNHLNVCGNVPLSDPMSTWPDNGLVPVEGWDTWDDADVAAGRLDMMAYTYCTGSGWIHPERWRRIFLKAGPPA